MGEGKGDGREDVGVGVVDVSGVKPLTDRPKRAELEFTLFPLLTIVLTLKD